MVVEASAFNNGYKHVNTLKEAEFKACFSVFFFVFFFLFLFFFNVQIQREVGNSEKRSDHGSQNHAVRPQFEWFPAFLA